MIQDRPIASRPTVESASAPILVESIQLSRDRTWIAGVADVGTTRLLKQTPCVTRTDRPEDRASRGQIFIGLAGNDEVLETFREPGTGQEEGPRTAHRAHHLIMGLVPGQCDLSLHSGGRDATLESGVDVAHESKADITIESA